MSMLKIPMRYASVLGVSKSFLVRVNQGKRRLSLSMAPILLKAAEAQGESFDLLGLRPDLIPLLPYICPRRPPLKARRKAIIKKKRKK